MHFACYFVRQDTGVPGARQEIHRNERDLPGFIEERGQHSFILAVLVSRGTAPFSSAVNRNPPKQAVEHEKMAFKGNSFLLSLVIHY